MEQLTDQLIYNFTEIWTTDIFSIHRYVFILLIVDGWILQERESCS